jgi:RNA recognition motif-containing protein
VPPPRIPQIDVTNPQRALLEAPSRTLFIRNIAYEADQAWLRSRFESFGQVRSYFEPPHKRGLLFVAYVSV